MNESAKVPRNSSILDPDVLVRGSAQSYAQEIVVGRHRLCSDEPVASGGTDAGPPPYELLLSALGSCTSMTVGMYARRKEWPLEGIVVRLWHSKIHAEDCMDCEAKAGILDLIKREIELTGPLTTEQRSKLLEIAEKCPVHRTLQSEINIQSWLAQ